MSSIEQPRGRSRLVVAALVAGHSTREAADQAGVSYSTARRVRQRWSDHITAERDRLAEQAAARLLDLIPQAVEAFAALVASPVPGVRLAAARYVLDAALRWRSESELERRLRELEADRDQPTEQWTPWAGRIEWEAS
jgi:hypothetical protein